MANSPLNDLIQQFGSDVVEKAMQNLGAYRTVKGKKRRAVPSDNLIKSLGYYYNSKKGLLEFFAKGSASNYADFVEKGVNGTRSGVGSPYSFKSGGSGGGQNPVLHPPLLIRLTRIPKPSLFSRSLQ